MIIVVGGIKGGIGKTTIAINFAVMLSQNGQDVLLIDADDQSSSTAITAWREETYENGAGYALARLTGKTLATQVQRHAEKYDHVVIDVGGRDTSSQRGALVGRDTSSQRGALVVADIYMVPFPPKSLDVDTLDQVETLVNLAKAVNPDLRAVSFLNKAYPRNRDNDAAADLLRDSAEIDYLDTRICDRKAVSDAISEGRGVIEYRPRNPKAIAEITALYEAVMRDSVLSP